MNIYAIGTLLLDRFRWLPLLTFLIPNPSFFWQIIQGKGLGSVVWDSTRTISNTINEYPLFSFIWGDVHAHVISIFNQCFLIFLLLYAYKHWESLDLKGRTILAVLGAISLGSMPLINTWDVLIYAPITVIVLLLILRRSWGSESQNSALVMLLALPVVAVLSYLPFYIQLQTHTGGVSFVKTPSDPIEFLLVSGLFIALILASLSKDISKKPWLLLIALPFIAFGYVAAAIAVIPTVYLAARIFTEKDADFANLLAFFGLAILIACELIYLKDNMGDTYFRMNTVFKTYLPAWIMLSTASLVVVGRWLSTRVPRVKKKKAALFALLAIGILFIVPFAIGYNADYGTGTLDGLAYLDTTHPGDAAAVAFLRGISGNETIVEAEGGDYSYYSRVSSFTGIPGIVGMPFHEFMWRSDDSGWFSSRLSDIRTMYENPDQTISLMRKYHATLLYVGDPERERYNVQVTGYGLEKIYSAKGTDIYRLAY